jgi:2-hydroxychromene-2-carboxylate isomerase
MAKRVEFFFDYGSPFSYLADTQLPAIARRTGAEMVYRPILLGAVLKATGNASPITIPAKGKYMGLELERWAKRYGVPMKMNPHFPINTLRLMRGAIAAQSAGCFAAYHAAMYPAFWVEGQNLRDDEVLCALLDRVHLDRAALDTDESKNILRANTDEAVARGAFGAPTFFIDGAMFWGNDRLDWVEQALNE